MLSDHFKHGLNNAGVQVPTTLMAAVDAAVGIKTAVNFNNRKNKMGTYCPPLAVFLDRAYLRTLDQRNLSNGAAEMLKMVTFRYWTILVVVLFPLGGTKGVEFAVHL